MLKVGVSILRVYVVLKYSYVYIHVYLTGNGKTIMSRDNVVR